jgi:hypothetical protein
MADTNAILGSLAARPEATQNMTSVADMMRQRQMQPYQQAQMQAQTAQTQAQLPIQQGQAQQLDLENQQRQIALQDQQRQMEYWSNPEKYSEDSTEAAQPSVAGAMSGAPPATPQKVQFAEQMLGLSSDDPLAKQTNGMIRAGVTPNTVATTAQGLLKMRADILKQSADKQELTTKGLAAVNQGLAPIAAEKDPEKRAAMLAAAEPELQKLSAFDPSLHQAIMNADPQHLDSILSLTTGLQASLEYGTKQAQLNAEKLKTEPPSDQQRQDAVRTIASYPAIPESMKQGFSQEIKNAPTIAQAEKIQERADAAQQSFQRSSDARMQAETMADVEKRKAVQLLAVKDDADLATTLQNSQGIRGLLDMSAGGNQQATQAALVRFAEHEVVEGGVKRFNETELNALGPNVGTKLRQLEAWKAKNFSGKLPDATNAEIQKILDYEDQQAHDNHAQKINSLSGRMGVQLAPEVKAAGGTPTGKNFTAPSDAPPAPKEDGHKLKKNGQVIAVSKGGSWQAPA